MALLTRRAELGASHGESSPACSPGISILTDGWESRKTEFTFSVPCLKQEGKCVGESFQMIKSQAPWKTQLPRIV